MSNNVAMMGKYRVVDLTKFIDPATETRRCKLRRFNTGGPIPDFHTDVDITTHLGTHCECPYHHDDNWPDASSLPISSFMGRGIYVKITGLAPRAYLTPEVLDKFVGPKCKPGDVLILDSDYRIPAFTSLTNTDVDKRLLVNGSTAQWMVDHQIKSVGFGEGVSIENSNEDIKPLHDICLANNITFLEVLQNLDELQSEVFFVSFAPMRIKGLDSCPVRVYAIEGISDFS